MRQKLTSILLALFCAVGTASAIGNWVPEEPICRFCNNFKFDHAFTFISAGGVNDEVIYHFKW